MKSLILVILPIFLFSRVLYGQSSDSVTISDTLVSQKSNWNQNDFHPKKQKGIFSFTPELLLGVTMDANENFPKTKMQKQLIFNLGRDQSTNSQEWAQRLKGPTTGVSLGFTDLGNKDSLGYAISAIPFIEFKIFKSNRFKILSGLGASYFTKKFDPVTNPNNMAVTTDFTWAFRMYLLYKMFSTRDVDWRVGVGYSHHSNGHTRLLNQGYNSFLLSFSAEIKNLRNQNQSTIPTSDFSYKKTKYSYLEFRSGWGQNVLALAFNDPKNVFTVAGEYGFVYNNTWKIGLGLYYRFYEHYYDYIKGNESLVQDGQEYDYFKDNPWYYATNFGVSLRAEVMMNHIAFDVQLGYNFHKPFYKLDWKINQGWDNTPREIPEYWQLGELDSNYKFKYRISSRLGLKYYLIGMDQAPRNNFYIGAHLNANLGQADFTELNFGFVHRFKRTTR